MEKTKNKLVAFTNEDVRNRILTFRGVQVMIDRDLAKLYEVETKVFNQAVKRNIERFPNYFRFQLTQQEFEEILRSQFVTSSRHGGRRYLPYVFTEQGVAMLSAVLKSDTAVKVSIEIMNAFVSMRRFLISNAKVFERLDSLELKQLKTDNKIEQVLDAIDSKKIQPKQGIFFNGQVFDAYKFVSGLIRNTQKSILLIDNYIDETVFDLFTKKKKNVNITIFTNRITKAMLLDVKKFNAQYPPIQLKKFTKAHDRFLIIDELDVYHFGASLKDLGKKWFAFSKMDKTALSLLENLKKIDSDK